jgi:N-acetylmuramoyl-L-alanine amidase
MKKRGDLSIYFVIEILAAIFVVYILISVAESYGTYDVFEQMRLSRKLAMQVNALNTLAGNAYLVDDDTSKYEIKFYKDRVDVFKENTDILKSSYSFVNNKNSILDYSFVKSNKLVLIKDGNKIKVSTKIPDKFSVKDFSLNTKDENWEKKIILIDPGHGGNPDNIRNPGDFGNVNNELKESEITFNIANSLSQLMGNVRLTRISDEYGPTTKQRLDEIDKLQPEITVSLHISSKDDESNDVLAYINIESEKKLQSKKLATLILEEMAKQLDITNTNIIPLFIDDLDKNDPKMILNNNNVTVYLEIGNIKSQKGVDMFKKDIPKIVNSINNAIIKYFN